MVRQIVWLTGLSGAGKTYTADYLNKEQGFIHVDGDNAFLSNDPVDQDNVSKLHKAFAGWFKEEECDPEEWTPFFDKLCKRIVSAAVEHPEKNIVVSFSNYRELTRLYARNLVTKLLSETGDKSAFRYIALTVSPEAFARRQYHRIEKFIATQGWTMQHYWENIRKHADPFKDKETCLRALEVDKDGGLVGFQSLDSETHPEDVTIDTSDSHKGVLEFIHKSLALGPVKNEIYNEAYVKSVADIQFDRLEKSKEALKKLQERLSEEKGENTSTD